MYPLWEKKEFLPAERSICYSIEPQLKSPIDVESLTSYLQRLAEAHSVKMASFIKVLVFPLFKEKSDINSFYKIYRHSYAINGFNMLAANFLSALKKLTCREDLRGLTLKGISPLLTNNDIKVVRQWCPDCFNEQYNSDGIIYEKLVWSIKSISICLQHQCKLESTCPSCYKEINNLELDSVVGFCPKCKSWLGVSNKNTDLASHKINQLIDWQHWVYFNINELLSDDICLKQLSEGFILNKVSEFISNNFNKTGITVHELAKKMNYSRCTLFNWKAKRQKISFESLLVMSYCANRSIKTILFENDTNEVNTLREFSRTIELDKRPPYLQYSKHEKGKILDEIIKKNEFPPPKLGDVTKSLGFKSIESVRAYFPQECKLIAKNYKQYRSELRKQKMNSAKVAIKASAEKAVKMGQIPNHSFIHNDTKLGKLFANKEIRIYMDDILSSFEKL